MSYETFAQQLRAARSRGDQFTLRAREAVEGEALLPQALEELSVALEELRVTEEEVRVQNEQLVEGRQSVEAQRDHYRELFELAPVAYLVTDRVGVIRQVNRRAASLLGVPQRALVGQALARYVAAEDRPELRGRLDRLGGLDGGGWQLRLAASQREPIPVLISTSTARDQTGEVTELRWALQEPAAATSRPTGQPTLTAEPSAAPDWNNLAEGLYRVVRTAVPLLRADGAGLMLADADGTLHVVTGSDPDEQAFERAERDLGEGPCIDAFASAEVVSTQDLRADPRWPRLGPAALTNRIRGVLSAPVVQDGQAIGTCNAYTTRPRTWTEADVEAMRAYAAMLAQLLSSASDARHKGELAAQLQFALESRVLIEQAKGILMERHRLDEQVAFTRLRRMARSSSRKLTEVARETIVNR